MLLSDWMLKNKVGAYKLARDIKIHPSYVYLLLHRRRRLSPSLALKIEKYTNGEVSRNELIWPEDFEDVKEDGNVQLKINLNKKPKTNGKMEKINE